MTTPEPSPAAELRTAAASLRAAVEDAPLCQHPNCGHYGGYHKVDADGLTVCQDCNYNAHAYVGPGFEMPDGIGLLLAAWLDAVGSDIGDHSECIGKARCELASALRIARRINTKEQP